MRGGVDDPRRLAALAESGLVESPPEAAFDRVTRLVSEVLNVPVALFSLVTADKQVFKSTVGVGDLRETPLSHSFCRNIIDTGSPLEVVDARIHPKLRDNPLVRQLGVVAYLGVPLTTADGQRLGALCAVDHEPREWTAEDLLVLRRFAERAMLELERTTGRTDHVAPAAASR
jgi:GAF domain-containing protein